MGKSLHKNKNLFPVYNYFNNSIYSDWNATRGWHNLFVINNIQQLLTNKLKEKIIMNNETTVLSASTLIGNEVKNPNGENLGEIKEIMLDVEYGSIAYAVLSFGGFLGIGDKLFAIPWEALVLSKVEKCFILDVDKERLKDAPGFDKDNWPKTPDRTFISTVHNYYGFKPYWERTYEHQI